MMAGKCVLPLFALLAISAGATPICVGVVTDLASDRECSATYAYAEVQHSFAYDWLDPNAPEDWATYDPPDFWMLHGSIDYRMVAEGSPYSVSARGQVTYDETLFLMPGFQFLSGFAFAEVRDEVKIVGGSGTGIVQFLTRTGGEFSFAAFHLPNESVFAFWGQDPPAGEFVFNQPFEYYFEANTRFDFDSHWQYGAEDGFVELLGIQVTDLEGRPIPGARIVPAEIPEPSSFLLAAPAALLLLRRWGRKRIWQMLKG